MPQYRDKLPVVYHKFIVFSSYEYDEKKLDDVDEEPTYDFHASYARCSNCGILHNVIDFTKSNIVQDEENKATFLTKEDMKFMIPAPIIGLLETYEAPQNIWEEVMFTLQHKKFDRTILLSKKDEGKQVVGKFLMFTPDGSPKLQVFQEQTTF